ncbi:MAG: hypothetical protein GY869_19105 [Planctomycetes bacterium]|nr:hypothetical protein [Planctomycetota bacterium]
MRNLTNHKMIYFKAFLFLLGGLLASVLILIDNPTLKCTALLIVAVWCFARSYYFAFYVIQHYIDPNYKFSSLYSFLIYLFRKK